MERERVRCNKKSLVVRDFLCGGGSYIHAPMISPRAIEITRLNPATIKNFVWLFFFVSLFHIEPCADIGIKNPSHTKRLVVRAFPPSEINFAKIKI